MKLSLPENISKGMIYGWLVQNRNNNKVLAVSKEQHEILSSLPKYLPSIGSYAPKIARLEVEVI